MLREISQLKVNVYTEPIIYNHPAVQRWLFVCWVFLPAETKFSMNNFYSYFLSFISYDNVFFFTRYTISSISSGEFLNQDISCFKITLDTWRAFFYNLFEENRPQLFTVFSNSALFKTAGVFEMGTIFRNKLREWKNWTTGYSC